MSMSTAASVETLAGGGAAPHEAAGDDEFRGPGARVEKSAELESVSTQPDPARAAAVVLLSAAAAAEPS